MTIETSGKISTQGCTCEKCGAVFNTNVKNNLIRCPVCGATYELESTEINDNEVKRLYNFVEFRCVRTTGFNVFCENKCLAPAMHCMGHLKDEDFADLRDYINRIKESVKEKEMVLEQMEESKKIWLIQEVSGIND